MRNLLQEYIELMLETVGQSSLLASKILGYAAEWATWQAFGGKSGLDLSKKDNRIAPAWLKASMQEREQYDSMYEEMTALASSKVYELGYDKSPPIQTPDAASTTEKVDVPTKKIDVHVKFNDSVRLAGFQRAKGDVEASKTAMIYDQVIKDFGKSLDIDQRFIDKNGFLRRPGGVKGMSKMDPAQRKVAAKLQASFQDARDQYRLAFTNSEKNPEVPGYREEFIASLDDAGIRDAILKDIKRQLLGESGRAAVYFKYFSSGPNDVRLETHQYSINDMIVTPVLKEATKFYQVTSVDGSKIYFIIEFRLDGGGHPPQLKVGKDLDVTTP